MAKVKVRINSAGARAVLRSPAVLADLEARAASIERAANAMCSADNMRKRPFEHDAKIGTNRARATVRTATPHGVYANNKRNVLIKSIDAGRG